MRALFSSGSGHRPAVLGPGDRVAGEVSILLSSAQVHCPALGTLEMATWVGHGTRETLTVPRTAEAPSSRGTRAGEEGNVGTWGQLQVMDRL